MKPSIYCKNKWGLSWSWINKCFESLQHDL